MDRAISILLPGGVPLEMVLVEAGYFVMGRKEEGACGSESPEHIVYISQDFYIGKYSITQAQWQSLMDYNDSSFIGLQRPVDRVSLLEIVNYMPSYHPAFLTLINKHLAKEKPVLAATQKFRLPTQAEWEYAAKGGPLFSRHELEDKKSVDLYPAYAGGDRLKNCGWFEGNNDVGTRPVGLKAPNKLGLYDMAGNVWEWCLGGFEDYNNRKETVTKDPAASNDSGFFFRGGSFQREARYCRSTYRDVNHPTGRNNLIGFRLVLSPSSGSSTSSYP